MLRYKITLGKNINCV